MPASSPASVRWLSVKGLLWSTRGRSWGFRFLHAPIGIGADKDWDSIYRSVFGENDRVPMACRGTVHLREGGQQGYVAARFFDTEKKWKDASGREIPHEMLFLLSQSDCAFIASTNWHQSVMDQVRDCYEQVFPLEARSLPATEELGLPQAFFVDQVGEQQPIAIDVTEVRDVVPHTVDESRRREPARLQMWPRLLDLIRSWLFDMR